MTRSLIVALKEIRSYLEDPVAMAYSLLLPVVIFALTYGALGNEQFNGTASIVNNDPGGKYSTLLIDSLDRYEGLQVEVISEQEAERKLERSDIQMALYIPEGFSDTLASGEQVTLTFRQRGNGGLEGQIAASLIRGVAEEIGQSVQVQGDVKKLLAGQGFDDRQVTMVTQKFMEREEAAPIITVTERTAGDSPDPVKQFLPGILTMFVLFAVNLTARALVEERRRGTLERLLTTRLTVTQLFTGKFLANMSRAFLQTFILLLLAYLVFQIFTPVSFLAALVLALIFSAATSAIGLIIGSLCRTGDQATWAAVLFTMVTAMLAGTFVPISGGVFYTLSRFALNTYANDALREIISSGGLTTALGNLGVLLAVAVVGLVLSRFLFRAFQEGR